MGYYYERQSEPEDKPPGCLDALIITRVVLGFMMWPVLAIIGAITFTLVTFLLFAAHPALALIPIGIAGVLVWLFAKWEQKRFRPPDA